MDREPAARSAHWSPATREFAADRSEIPWDRPSDADDVFDTAQDIFDTFDPDPQFVSVSPPWDTPPDDDLADLDDALAPVASDLIVSSPPVEPHRAWPERDLLSAPVAPSVSVFGELFVGEAGRASTSSDDTQPAADRAGAGNETRPAPDPLDWPPVPTGLFPPLPDTLPTLDLHAEGSAEFVSVVRSDSRQQTLWRETQFAPSTGGEERDDHERTIRSTIADLATQAAAPVERMSGRWSVPDVARRRSTNNVMARDLSEIHSPVLTIVFTILVMAVVLLFIYLVTPLLR